MRFLLDGPNIPDELLEARDKGDVIFLCGAGVSQPDLPNFGSLAWQVTNALGTPRDAPSRALLERIDSVHAMDPPFDQVFQHLKYEYGADYIDQLVSTLLDPEAGPSTQQHSIILRLSRSAAGQPQVVTTNFDRFFERVHPTLKIRVAPELPDLSTGQRLEGIVYLHGRLRPKSVGTPSRPTPLVLGSGDFGRAYLAEAWATRFITDLLRDYTIVLVGYSANDAPVRYLLQGVHTAQKRLTRIYAFERGVPDVVEARWRDRGVTAISYGGVDVQHALLWDTLKAWADRADNVDGWRESVLKLAARRPSELNPTERRQVYSLVRTDAGAKLFRECPTPPPAEWLCVFDRAIRFAEPQRTMEGETPYDPATHFGLDDDPPRSSGSENEEAPIIEDLLAPLPHETVASVGGRLASGGGEILPITPRLFHLSHWVARLLDDPALIWWATAYASLHPRLVHLIQWNLEHDNKPLPALARRLWLILLERFRQSPLDAETAWFAWLGRHKKDGWSTASLREFEFIMRPFLTCKRPIFGRATPPSKSWDVLRLNELANLDVQFVRRDPENLTVPTQILPHVFKALRRGLEQSVGMLRDIDIDSDHFITPTFIPTNGPGQTHYDDFDFHLMWVVRLFDRLVSEHPEVARREIGLWLRDERYLFDKLWLYACRNTALMSSADAATGLLGLSDASFWNVYQRRELLHALAGQWAELTSESRAAIERRIIGGRACIPDENTEEYRRHIAVTAAMFFGWLQLQGCELDEVTRNLLSQLRAADPKWDPSWDESVADDRDSRIYSVTVDADASQIQNVPISELISLVIKHSGRDWEMHRQRDPFRDLVQRRSRRAYLALAYEASHERYWPALWTTLLQVPADTSVRLRWSIAAGLVRLPTAELSKLLSHATFWFRERLPGLAEKSLDRALSLWDAILNHALPGNRGASADAGQVQEVDSPSLVDAHQDYERASTTPLGYLTDTLLTILSERAPEPASGIPAPIRGRLERLLSAAAPERRVSVATMAASLRWLHQVDPGWTEAKLVPYFAVDHPDKEAAWAGYAFDSSLAPPALFEKLKQPFLDAVKWLATQRGKEQALNHFTEALIIYCFWRLEYDEYLNFAETRTALQALTPKARAHAAWKLVQIVKENHNWVGFGKGFVEQAWPRELRFQSTATANSLVDLTAAAGNDFPDAVQSVLPLLVPVDHVRMLVHERSDDSTNSTQSPKLSSRFPEPFLALLDRVVGQQFRLAVYELPSVLKAIIEVAPELRQDPRWRRLNELVTRS